MRVGFSNTENCNQLTRQAVFETLLLSKLVIQAALKLRRKRVEAGIDKKARVALAVTVNESSLRFF